MNKILQETFELLPIPLPIEGHSGEEKNITPDCLPEQENSLRISESLSRDIINDDSTKILEL
ncbi:7341_t:CDS:2 [Gigaspora margarita]|uniref:7341_t:CDS:1 n=1 Tax=Gigaspora margarita TaxID=4874 RepID=A0ABN7UFP3_GIGMA|nr:7341_t:CDS:2 [Gigaspora margarita]